MVCIWVSPGQYRDYSRCTEDGLWLQTLGSLWWWKTLTLSFLYALQGESLVLLRWSGNKALSWIFFFHVVISIPGQIQLNKIKITWSNPWRTVCSCYNPFGSNERPSAEKAWCRGANLPEKGHPWVLVHLVVQTCFLEDWLCEAPQLPGPQLPFLLLSPHSGKGLGHLNIKSLVCYSRMSSGAQARFFFFKKIILDTWLAK